MDETALVLRLKRRAASDEWCWGGRCCGRSGEPEPEPEPEPPESRRAWAVGVGRCDTPSRKQVCQYIFMVYFYYYYYFSGGSWEEREREAVGGLTVVH